MNGPKTGAGVRAAACAPGSVEATDTQTPPPLSDTGVEITDRITIHWLSGSFDQPFEAVADLVYELTDNFDLFPLPYGGNGYKAAYQSVGGLRVYTDPGGDNMPQVHISVPGQACEYLGLEKLQILFCNAKNLTRVDVAFDGYEETPETLADWIERGDIRTRAKRQCCEFTRNLGGAGNRLYVGAITSMWSLCAYDRRGFTRLELRMKGERAARFQRVLLQDSKLLHFTCVGLLREFADFVDAQAETNVSRAPLKASWAVFTEGLCRVKMRLDGKPELTAERVVNWIEYQVSATLALYRKLGFSIDDLVKYGERRMKSRHKAILSACNIHPHAPTNL